MPGFYWTLERPRVVNLEWQDADGETHRDLFEDFMGRCVQHEIDHLDGVLLPDRIREAAEGWTRQYRRTAERALAKWGI
jgi:peptide deformylase